jgi:para-aminobenzoate synthetase component I
MKTAMKSALRKMNEMGSAGEPFFFIFDFEMRIPEVIPLSSLNRNEVMYDFEGYTNAPVSRDFNKELYFWKSPVSFSEYSSAFSRVMLNLIQGNSYLVNLTFSTRIETNLGLYEIFKFSKAKYKLWFKDKFVCFSPETFVKISEGKIFSFPMKGTIDASLPDAESLILQNKKETAEHNTIVDLIRNDLSMVSSEVKVELFRYIDRIKTAQGDLLQVSSRISGKLPGHYESGIGSTIGKLLPAGSVTGAPKEKTVEIINSVENFRRGYYTGIAGIFTGKELISCVLIRFIEQTDYGMFYKSGGGITIHSKAEEEYDELIRKVYVPLV